MDDAGDEQVLEVASRPSSAAASIARKRTTSDAHGGLEQAVLAAGEHPVDGGPAAPGLAGDVVEGGLGHAPPAHARERGVDEPGFLGRKGELDRRHP